MPLTPNGIYYADNSTPMSIADITAAMATSIDEAIPKFQITAPTNGQVLKYNAALGVWYNANP